MTQVRKSSKLFRIKAAFYSKGLIFPIVKLLTSKSAKQDSDYGSTDFTPALLLQNYLQLPYPETARQ